MALPASFARDGLITSSKPKFKGVMIGCDGPAGSGKSEFAHGAPGPGIFVALDRGLTPMLDNPNPPKTRRPDFAYVELKPPMAEGATKEEFMTGWALFRDTTYKAAKNPDCRTIILDGDSDSWELQRLAGLGKLTQVPPLMYVNLNAARRLFISRLHDSGKIIIATNKVKKSYKPAFNQDGTPTMKDGKQAREWDGVSYERQGFDDHEYLWNIQLTHLYNEEKQEWGIRMVRVKANPSIQGEELWGDDCNMQNLLQCAYPNVDLKTWGY